MTQSHRGKVVLVTGASSGIGNEIARLAAAEGYELVLVARGRGRLETFADELVRKHGVGVHVEPVDLSDPSAPKRLFDSLTTRGVRVDILVNNAGFGSNGRFWELDREGELAMVQVNVSAVLDLTHLFLPGMVERGRGRILNVASTAGFQPGPGMATYYATKAFLISFGEAIAHELRGTGVTVTTLCPGATATEFASTAGNDATLLFKLQVSKASVVARDGWQAMHRGRVLAISGWLNRLVVFSVRFTPRAVVRTLASFANR